MPSDIARATGAVLRRLRKDRRWTIEEAALRAKLSPVYYGEIERGKENPTIRVLERILDGMRESWTSFGAAVEAERQGSEL